MLSNSNPRFNHFKNHLLMKHNKGLKILISIFVVLAIILVITTIVDSKKKRATFKSVLIDTDTTSISKIYIQSKTAPDGYELMKKDSAWYVSVENKEYPVEQRTMANILQQLDLVKTKRVAAKSKDKWSEYEVTDSLGTFVTIYENGTVVSNFVVGKFSFTQSQNPYQRQPDVHSYIRLLDENEVYLVDGMLSMTFNRRAQDFRNPQIIGCNKASITKVSFNYQTDSSFVLVKENDAWMVNGTPADSLKTETFLNKLSNKSHRNYYNADLANKTPDYSITVSGNSMSDITIDAFVINENETAIVSSQNKGNVFSFSIADFKQLFVGSSEFIE